MYISCSFPFVKYHSKTDNSLLQGFKSLTLEVLCFHRPHVLSAARSDVPPATLQTFTPGCKTQTVVQE